MMLRASLSPVRILNLAGAMISVQAGRVLLFAGLIFFLPYLAGTLLIWSPYSFGHQHFDLHSPLYLAVHYGYLTFSYLLNSFVFCTLGQSLLDSCRRRHQPFGQLMANGTRTFFRSLWLVLPWAFLSHVLYQITPWATLIPGPVEDLFFAAWMLSGETLSDSVKSTFTILKAMPLKVISAYLLMGVCNILLNECLREIDRFYFRKLPYLMQATVLSVAYTVSVTLLMTWSLAWYVMARGRALPGDHGRAIATVFE